MSTAARSRSPMETIEVLYRVDNYTHATIKIGPPTISKADGNARKMPSSAR